jgi:hypothetical protein
MDVLFIMAAKDSVSLANVEVWHGGRGVSRAKRKEERSLPPLPPLTWGLGLCCVEFAAESVEVCYT